MLISFDFLILQDGVMWECVGHVLRGRGRFELLGTTADALAGAGDRSNAVDIFNATSGRWTTAALSVARNDLAATSLPNQGLAVFAGGFSSGGTYIVLYCKMV